VAAVLLAGVIALGACGADEPAVSEPAARLLHAQVAAVRTAAESRDRAGAEQQLASLRASLVRLREQEEITGDAAARIRRAADAVAARLTLVPTTTTTTTTTTVPPREEDDRRERGPGHDRDAKKGKEKNPRGGPGHDDEWD
jgi:hypothetical protein